MDSRNRIPGITKSKQWVDVSTPTCRDPSRHSAEIPVAPRQSSEKLFSFYPGLEKRITVDEWIAERNALHEEAFKRVQLLPGALSLVKRLHDAGVPMAIATGSNNKNFKWKTVSLSVSYRLARVINMLNIV
jgi:beta-phosphoglucomutase-like phosphatase (HAD superfamily)